MTRLIAGLGNPGTGYSRNRHNMVFICLNYFARLHSIKLNRSQCLARVGRGKIDSIDVVLARPQTYMNESGRSVGRLVQAFNIDIPDLLVVCDDMDLPLGRIRIRMGGSSGGHKGLKSIIAELCTEEFPRLRIGIGRPAPDSGGEVINHVLSDFLQDEVPLINETVPRASDAILTILKEGVAPAMNRFNG